MNFQILSLLLFHPILFDRNPNNKDDEFLNKMEWNKFELNKENYLEIGTHLVEKNGLFLERFAVWDRLFPPIESGSAKIINCAFYCVLLFIIFNVIST